MFITFLRDTSDQKILSNKTFLMLNRLEKAVAGSQKLRPNFTPRARAHASPPPPPDPFEPLTKDGPEAHAAIRSFVYSVLAQGEPAASLASVIDVGSNAAHGQTR